MEKGSFRMGINNSSSLESDFKSKGFADLQALLIILYFLYAVLSPVFFVDNTSFWRVLSGDVKL